METGALVNVAFSFLGIFIFIVLLLLALGIGFIGWLLYGRWKRYTDFTCVIFSKDGLGNDIINFDSAGIFVDSKTKNKRFFVKRENVGLSPDNVPVVYSGKKKIVFLYKRGLKNLSYINFRSRLDEINKSLDMELEVTEEDVNWAINAYERQKRIFSLNVLLQYLPFILLAFVSLIILIIFIYFFKQFDQLSATATALKQTAEILAKMNAGQIVG